MYLSRPSSGFLALAAFHPRLSRIRPWSPSSPPSRHLDLQRAPCVLFSLAEPTDKRPRGGRSTAVGPGCRTSWLVSKMVFLTDDPGDEGPGSANGSGCSRAKPRLDQRQ